MEVPLGAGSVDIFSSVRYRGVSWRFITVHDYWNRLGVVAMLNSSFGISTQVLAAGQIVRCLHRTN